MARVSRTSVQEVRRFNRFYTKQIGVLDEGLLQSPFSLTEVRILYELANRKGPIATELARELALDPGYLSRILAGFEKKGLVKKTISAEDGRRGLLSLTALGKKTFAPLNTRSNRQVETMLGRLPAAGQLRLVQAMETIERLLGGREKAAAHYVLRAPRSGDFGWVVHRHGVLYAQEYGWDARFEALVAEIVARFVQNFDSRLERCWIAELEGRIVGCVFLVRRSAATAQLRMLLVEPEARGLGIGARLVEECVAFARRKGYRKITLWTNSVLHAARRIYERAGFRLVRSEPHMSFGHHLIAETWEKKWK